MCGKITQAKRFADLVRLADLLLAPDEAVETITPMRLAHVIALDGDGRRRSVPMRWGLVPAATRHPSDAAPHIHARAETIDVKSAFRDSFAKRRGILLATTFNEGEEVTPSRTQQYVLTPKDGAPAAIAVIWDRWSDGAGPLLLSFAMITTPANPLVAQITDRMPALLEDGDWAKWLGEEPATVEDLKAMLKPSARDMDMRRAEKTPPSKPAKPRAQLEMF